jgi:hypothetical protein
METRHPAARALADDKPCHHSGRDDNDDDARNDGADECAAARRLAGLRF